VWYTTVTTDVEIIGNNNNNDGSWKSEVIVLHQCEIHSLMNFTENTIYELLIESSSWLVLSSIPVFFAYTTIKLAQKVLINHVHYGIGEVIADGLEVTTSPAWQ